MRSYQLADKLKRLLGGLARRWHWLQRAEFEQAFFLAGKVGACDVRDTIVIAGSPRSGTTWLLEILYRLPGYKGLNEPLIRERIRQNHGFGKRTYISPSQSASKQRAYLLDVLTGQVGPPPLYRWSYRGKAGAQQLIEHATHDRLVVKFCRINRMLHWFEAQFDTRGIVFIVRHPCAAINSMLHHGPWEQDSLQEPHIGYIDHLPESLQNVFRPILGRASTHVEVLAILWCLDQYLPLVHHDSHPWILVPYERLVRLGREELRRVATALDVELHPDMIGQLRVPSSSAEGKFFDREVEQQLSKWKRNLSTRQIDNILRIVDDTGLSPIYTDAIEPDYSRLNSFQKPEWTW